MSSFVFEELEAHGEIVGAGNTPAERAARIVSDAETQAAEIEADARRTGYEAGYAEGMAQVARELEIPRATFAAAVEAIQAARAEVSDTVERHAVELALAIAERVVGAALDVQPELVCNVVASALRRVVERDRLAIDVNPEDVPVVRAWLASQSEIAIATVEVRDERRVPRGGCVVRTAEGEVDARVGEQLARAGEVLREAFAERRSA